MCNLMAGQLRSQAGERDGASGQAQEPTAAEAVQEAGRQAGARDRGRQERTEAGGEGQTRQSKCGNDETR